MVVDRAEAQVTRRGLDGSRRGADFPTARDRRPSAGVAVLHRLLGRARLFADRRSDLAGADGPLANDRLRPPWTSRVVIVTPRDWAPTPAGATRPVMSSAVADVPTTRRLNRIDLSSSALDTQSRPDRERTPLTVGHAGPFRCPVAPNSVSAPAETGQGCPANLTPARRRSPFAEPSRDAYRPEAAELAFERTVAFLREELGAA